MGDAVWMIHVAPLYDRASARLKLARLRTYLAQRIRDLLLFADVARVEWDVVMPLYDVEYGHRITASNEGFYDMAPEETAAANNEVNVF